MSKSEEQLRLSRRQLLQGLGGLAGATAAGLWPQLRPGGATAAPADTATVAGSTAVPEVAIIALNRMGFGPRPGDVDAFNALGSTPEERLFNYIEEQINPSAISDTDFENRLANFGGTTLNKTLAQLWQDHVVPEPPWEVRMLPLFETERVAFLRAVYSQRQLNEVMADFWHNHFNIYADWETGPIWVHYDRDVIRKHMWGNFRQMLGAVAKSPNMLFYLDNYLNTRAGPNENWARELFELYTMGAENYLGVKSQNQVPKDSNGRPIGYVDRDVYEATRCFTGWSVDEYYNGSNTGLFVYKSENHDRFQKFVLGNLLDPDRDLEDGEDVLDLTAFHPGTARYICRKLCRRLVSDYPPESLVLSAADLFMAQKNAPDQLKQVVRHILRSAEFRTTWGAKMKRPFEYVASVMRALNANISFRLDHDESNGFMWNFSHTGQELFRWHPPNGYPDVKDAWQSTAPMLMMWRIANWLPGISENYLGENYYADVVAQTPQHLRTATTLADYWANRILGRPLGNISRFHIIAFMAQDDGADTELPIFQTDWPGPWYRDRLRVMTALIMQTPEFHER